MPLPPYYPPTTPLCGMIIVNEAHETIEEIIINMWDYCMELEDEYHKTGTPSVLIQFAMAIMVVQYWEDVLLSKEGCDVFRVYF